METTSSHPVTRLVIEGPLCIYNAVENKQRLIAAVRAGEAISLDLSQVDELDTAGFQLLMLAKRESIKLGKQLSLEGISPVVQEVIHFFNMDGYFGEPVGDHGMQRGGIA